MRAGAHARTVFAGFGVSGSLLAAIGGVFLVVGGVMAFDQWPAGLASAPEKSLVVAAIPPATASAPRVALPAAAPAPAGAGQPGAVPAAGRRVPGRRADTTGGAARRPVAPPTAPPAGPGGPAPAPAPAAGPVPAAASSGPVPAAASSGLATSVESTTSAAADTVRGLGARVPGAAPVTELVGGLVDDAGQTAGGLLRGLGLGR